MPTILLADDHQLVRKGVRALLEAEPDLQVVGEAEQGTGVPDLVERLKPDILLVDLMLPGLNGLEITWQVRRRSPATQVVILSMYASEGYVLEALRNGAAGYVLKQSSAADVLHAIREVLAGRRYLSPPLTERAIEVYLQKTVEASQDPYDRLTPREREVLHLAAQGYSGQEIAARLSISPRTVETHRTNVLQKLGLRSQAELIRYALRRGLILLDE